jgi:glycogen operon protein
MASPKPSPVADAHPAPPAPFLGPAFDRLGVTLGPDGGTLRVWSEDATGIDLVVFDADDLDWITASIPLTPAGRRRLGGDDAASARRRVLRASRHGSGRSRADLQPREPAPRSLREAWCRVRVGQWRAAVVDDEFDWNGSRPQTPMDRTVIYEAHVKGLTKRHPDIPPRCTAPTRDSAIRR